MNRSMRFFTALGLLIALICVAASCGPQPAPGNNLNAPATNAKSSSSPGTAGKCSISLIQENIITSISNTYGQRDQYVNVTTRANVIFLYGYTAPNSQEYKSIIEAAKLLIINGGCEGQVELDTSKFFDGPPPEGDPMRPAGNACASGFKKCGAICIPDNEDCFIRAPIVPAPSPTGTPMQTATPTPARAP